MKELFKDIGYGSGHRIGSRGTLLNKRGKKLNPATNQQGVF